MTKKSESPTSEVIQEETPEQEELVQIETTENKFV